MSGNSCYCEKCQTHHHPAEPCGMVEMSALPTGNVKTAQCSIEHLHHFRCGCEKDRWFSIAEPGAANEKRDYLFCPWCGDRMVLTGAITQSDIDWAMAQLPPDK